MKRDARAEQRAEAVGFGVELPRPSVALARRAPSRSAASRASATSVGSIRSSICRRIVVANSTPATASAMHRGRERGEEELGLEACAGSVRRHRSGDGSTSL